MSATNGVAMQRQDRVKPNGASSATSRGQRRIVASPIARRLAQEACIDVATITGSGPGGRIVKRDVAAARDSAGAGLVAASEAISEALPSATVPDFSLEVDVLADALVALREELRTRVAEGPVPSYNDFIVKACAIALRAHPRANGAYRDGHLEAYGRVNVGVAVAADGALVVPVVTDADQKSLGAIARQTRDLAERGRSGTLTPAELSVGTFTVSNLGMFGVSRFSAVINEPQAAILAVGALGQRAIVRDDRLIPAHVMTLTLSVDHRVLYGADAATFLATIRSALEEPLRLLL